jgi:hypothetical protein
VLYTKIHTIQNSKLKWGRINECKSKVNNDQFRNSSRKKWKWTLINVINSGHGPKDVQEIGSGSYEE